MRAALLTSPGNVKVVDDWPAPSPGPDDVVVAMHGVAICGSDLAVHTGTRAVPTLPWVMGHEGFGEVVAVGSRASDRDVGQRVVIEPNYCCLECSQCGNGRTSACPNRAVVGMRVPGLLAEQVAVPARFAWPAPRGIDDADLVCAEPLTVARTAARRLGIGAGDTCLVVGAGSQGLLLCQLLLAIGALPYVVEPHPGRRTLAERIGARTTSDDGTTRFSYVVETSGAGDGVATALRSADTAARVILVGLGSEQLGVSSADLVRRQLRVEGSLIYDHPEDFQATVSMLADGTVTPSEIVQGRFELRSAGQAFTQSSDIAGKTWVDLRPSHLDPHATSHRAPIVKGAH